MPGGAGRVELLVAVKETAPDLSVRQIRVAGGTTLALPDDRLVAARRRVGTH